MDTKKNKWVWTAAAVVLITIIGFFTTPTDKDVGVSDIGNIFEGFYVALLVFVGVVFALAVIAGIGVYIIHRTRSRKPIGEKIFNEKKKKWVAIPILLGWGVFIATIIHLHPNLWNAWYGDKELFIISQAVFLLILIMFYGHPKFFYILLTTATIISFWSEFYDRLEEKGVIKIKKEQQVQQAPAKPIRIVAATEGTYRFCWEDPEKKKTEPCSKKGELLLVKIKEYNSALFTFTVSWEEGGKFKERALFHWDRIANPEYGTWHQKGSKTKEHGTWAFKKMGEKFVGWHTGKDGKVYPSILIPYRYHR